MFLISFASAEFTLNSNDGIPSIKFEVPTPPINYSEVNVNNSDYLDGYDSTHFVTWNSWIQDLFAGIKKIFFGSGDESSIYDDGQLVIESSNYIRINSSIGTDQIGSCHNDTTMVIGNITGECQ